LMLLTLKGTPFIYYGEEIGLKESRLPRHLLQDTVGLKWYPFYRGRDGARTPMQWDSSPGAGFTGGKPWLPVGPQVEQRNVSSQDGDPGSLLNFYRRLIWLRKQSPALSHGSFNLLTGEPDRCFVYRRESGSQSILVALNFSGFSHTVNFRQPGELRRVLFSTDPGRERTAATSTLTLGPYEGCLLE
ncbi:MAG TPA: DUF3459 domain-containing protein, partial [Firmicutes bacterium]|nr:DUF3459 domain-containing protein [Bacillota bacterium]